MKIIIPEYYRQKRQKITANIIDLSNILRGVLALKVSRICKIRIISFIFAAALAVVGCIIMMNYRQNQLRETLNNSYNESLDELANYLTDMSETLKNESYTANPQQMRIFANKLSANAACAKSALERLPVSSQYTSGLYRFLSQAGEYSQYLAAVSQKTLSDDEQKALDELYNYAKTMSAAVSDIQAVAAEQTTGWWADEAAYRLKAAQGKADLSEIEKYASEVSKSTDDYAKINYDGANSDHLLNGTARLIENESEISQDNAAQKASEIMGVKRSDCKLLSTDNGNVKVYLFKSGTKQAAITAKGGELYYMTDYRESGSQKIDRVQAKNKAVQFVSEHYGNDFRLFDSEVESDQCVFSFAYVQDGVICYPDEIKVGVALDNGEIMNVQAHGYVHNHQERDIKFANDEQAAKKAISNKLLVDSAAKCVINVDSDREYCCYELVCRENSEENTGGEKLHIFVDADNLFIRKIVTK